MRPFPRSWFVAWLLVLGIPFAAYVLWARAGYTEGEEATFVVLPLVVAAAATTAWGFVMGRRGRWGSLVVSPLVGASVMVIFLGIADRIEPSGGEGYVLLTWMIYCAALAVVMGVGAVLGFASSLLAARKDR